ncbi:Tetratricopeptide repeat protein [Candidatus Magnetomoraceae bacterium gMMP-13]
MNFISEFIIYLILFRLSIITVGAISIVLGYRLFCRGILSEGSSGSAFEGKVGSSQFILKNAAPGTFFALFGVIIICVMVASGSPEMTLEFINKAEQNKARTSENETQPDIFSAQLRGDKGGLAATTQKGIDYEQKKDTEKAIGDKGGLVAATQKGIDYEEEKDIEKAIEAYKEALNMLADPMNYLAWLYHEQGERDKALPLARLAVEIAPDNPHALDTLAEILFGLGEYAEALKVIKKAAALEPNYQNKLSKFQKAIEK